MGSFRAADLGRGRLRQRRHQRPPAPFHHVIDPLSQPGGFSAAGRADHPELVGPHLSFPHPCQLILRGGLPAPESVSPSPVLHLPASITTTLPQLGQFLAGNRFAEGKATKLSSAWTGRHEEVLKVHFLRTVVVILGRGLHRRRCGGIPPGAPPPPCGKVPLYIHDPPAPPRGGIFLLAE